MTNNDSKNNPDGRNSQKAEFHYLDEKDSKINISNESEASHLNELDNNTTASKENLNEKKSSVGQVIDWETRDPTIEEVDDDEFFDEEDTQHLEVSSEFKIKKIWRYFLIIGIIGLTLAYITKQTFDLIYEMIFQNSVFGIITIIFLTLITIGLVGIIVREWLAIKSLGKIDHLRLLFERGESTNGLDESVEAISELISLYSKRPELIERISKMKGYLNEIMEPIELIKYAEDIILSPLDKEAERLTMFSAIRISAITAVNSQALLEFLYVTAENLRLVRKIMVLYGGRPGVGSSYRLFRTVIINSVTAVGSEVGGGVLSQIFGKNFLTNFSKRLGTGLVNGYLTIRIGTEAQKLCRPCPYIKSRKPVMSRLFDSLKNIVVTDK